MLLLGAGIVGGLLAMVAWPSASPVDVKEVGSRPAEIFDDTGAEMSLVTLAFRRPPHRRGYVYLERQSTTVEANVAGNWIEMPDRPGIGSVGPDKAKEMVVLMPAGATLCRVRLRYAGASLRWRLACALGKFGIMFRPASWFWVDSPEGPNPGWKEANIQVPLGPDVEHQAHPKTQNE